MSIFFCPYSVVCIIIACLCLTGTLVDLCVVQQSWKFWTASRLEYERDSRVPQSEERGLLSNGLSNHSNSEEAAPLLSTYGDSSNGNIQIRRPTEQDKGT